MSSLRRLSFEVHHVSPRPVNYATALQTLAFFSASLGLTHALPAYMPNMEIRIDPNPKHPEWARRVCDSDEILHLVERAVPLSADPKAYHSKVALKLDVQYRSLAPNGSQLLLNVAARPYVLSDAA